jgi:serine/threonine protein kinase
MSFRTPSEAAAACALIEPGEPPSGPVRSRRAPYFGAGRFRVVRRLGRGSQGAVWLCHDERRDDSLVALKIARSNERARSTLAREAFVLRALHDVPSVPTLRREIRRGSSTDAIVTDFAAGEPLGNFLAPTRLAPARHGRSAQRAKILRIAAATSRAVLEIARRGFVHRDLKPDHIIVVGEGSGVRIIDFGLACSAGELPGDLSGTFAYASPEQVESRALGAKSDLFALGLILYEVAAGRPFFSWSSRLTWSRFVELRRRRLAGEIGVPGADSALTRLIRRLLIVDESLRADPTEVEARVEEIERRSA